MAETVTVKIEVTKRIKVESYNREWVERAVRDNWDIVFRHRLSTTDHDVVTGKLLSVKLEE